MSTPAELLQIHLPALTQIVTQVCAKACGRSGKIAVKFRIFADGADVFDAKTLNITNR